MPHKRSDRDDGFRPIYSSNNNNSSSSSLTDLSDAEINAIIDCVPKTDLLPAVSHPAASTGTATSFLHLTHAISEVAADPDSTEGANNAGASDDSDGSVIHPSKRMKMDKRADQRVTSALALRANYKTASSTEQLGTPPRSSPAPVDLITGSKELSPLLSPTLPPSLNALVDSITNKDQEAPIAQPKKSLKMVILSKTELDALKANLDTLATNVKTLGSHNSILRSHNKSLGTQNGRLREENLYAIATIEELNDSGPVDHIGCVSKADYQLIVTEADQSREHIVQLREKAHVLQECVYEWARREKLWETEKELLKNEVTQLVTKVQQFDGIKRELQQQIFTLSRRDTESFNRLWSLETIRVQEERQRADDQATILGLQQYIHHLHGLMSGGQGQASAQTQMQGFQQDESNPSSSARTESRYPPL